MKFNLKMSLLAGSAALVFGAFTVPTAVHAATLDIESADTDNGSADDNTIDDITSYDELANPSFDIDVDATYTISIDITDGDNAVTADNDMFQFTTGGASAGIIVSADADLDSSIGAGAVITTDADAQLGGGITILGSITASAGNAAIDLSNNANANATTITLTGAAASNGTITGDILLGTGATDIIVINGTDGGADINGDITGDSAQGGTLQVRADFTYDSTGTDTIDDINTIDIGTDDTFAIAGDESLASSNIGNISVTNTEGGAAIFDITGGGASVINIGAANTLNLTGGSGTLTMDVDNASTVDGNISIGSGAVVDSTADEALTFGAGGPYSLTLAGGNIRADVTFDATDGGTLDVDSSTTLNSGGSGSITVTNATDITVANGLTLTVGSGNSFASADNDTATLQIDGVTGGSAETVDFSGNSAATTVIDLDGDDNGTAGTVTASDITFTTDTNAVFDANLTLTNASVVNGALVFSDNGVELQVDGTSAVNGNVTFGTGVDTLDMNAGTLGDSASDTVNLGDGNDVITIDGGTITAAIDGGAGAGDALTFGTADFTIANNISNVETVDLGGRTITLTGDITGLDAADNSGLDVNSGVLNINDGGSVAGAIHSTGGSGTGTVNFGADSNGGTFTTGGIIEDVILTVTSGTVTTGAAVGGNSAIGAFTVADNARFNANHDVDATGSTLTVDGTLFVDTGVTVTATAVDTTGGANDDSVVIIEVTNTNGVYTNGTVAQAAGAIDLTDFTVNISLVGDNVDAGATVTVQDVFTGTGATTGPTTLTDSFLYDFALVDDGNNLDLTIDVNNSLTGTFTGSEVSGLASALESIDTSNADVNNLVTRVSTATTQQAVQDILSANTPEVNGSTLVTIAGVAGDANVPIEDRLASLRRGDTVTGMAAGNAFKGIKMWGQGFGSVGEQDERNGVAGYDYDTYGVAFGLDSADLYNDFVIGASFAYADTNANSDGANNTGINIDSYIVSLYGEFLTERGYYIDGVASYGYNEVDQKRYNVSGAGGTTASSDFGTDQFSARLEVGRDVNLESDMIVTPNVSASYVNLNAEDYTETGAGGLNQSVDTETFDTLELGLGVDVAWNRKVDHGVFKPKLSANYRYEVLDEKVETTSNFTGATGTSFNAAGFDPAQSRFDIGGSLSYYSDSNWDFSVSYTYDVREDFDAHSGAVRAGYKF